MMRYFIDTEYNWLSDVGEITPISIGIVAEDGREYYAIVFDHEPFGGWSPFVLQHVIPVLHDTPQTKVDAVRDELSIFLYGNAIEFWGDYAAFDYVVLSMLMGDFENWPRNWPMHINDLQQLGRESGPSAIPHNALADARAVREAFAGVTV